MPKKTFTNLNEAKKKVLTDAFLKEFSTHTFDDASLSSVVKSLGIAKGSVYQYFEDKQDLFLYLVGICSAKKTEYFENVKRESYPNYWEYFRDLYKKGIRFDLENPQQSHFLFNLVNNLNSPSVKVIFDSLLNNIISEFEKMINHEIELGLFRTDLPPKTMAFLLYKSGVAIQEQLEVFGEINPKESIRNNTPVYLGKEKVLMQTVDNYIELLKPTFNKK